eukprot:COSAG06_NODE_1320_length_9872_cov_49.877213_4_plen_80_part_00
MCELVQHELRIKKETHHRTIVIHSHIYLIIRTDVAERRVGRHGAGRVAKGDEDTAPGEAVHGNVKRRETDAVDHLWLYD